MTAPEAKARQNIDALLAAAGWHVCNVANADIHAGDGTVKGVAIREFPLNPGFGFADYLLYVERQSLRRDRGQERGRHPHRRGAAKRPLRPGPAHQPARLAPPAALCVGVHRRRNPLHQRLDPEPRARSVFAFFRPELLVQWLAFRAVDPKPGRTGNSAASRRSSRAPSSPACATCPAGHRMGQRRRALCAVARPNQRHHQPGKIPRRQQAQGLDPDGHRQRQNVYQHRLHLPPHQVWRCAPRAVSW
jgi:hypothetical protein